MGLQVERLRVGFQYKTLAVGGPAPITPNSMCTTSWLQSAPTPGTYTTDIGLFILIFIVIKWWHSGVLGDIEVKWT